MGTPVRHDALTPKDLQYYAPRKTRSGVEDPQSSQRPSSGDASTFSDRGSDDIAPLPDHFHPEIEDLEQNNGRSGAFMRVKTLVVVGAAAIVGLLVGIGLLGIMQGRDEPVAKAPEIPLATRLQTAASDLQKVSQPVVTPLLTVSDASGDMNVPLPLGVRVKNYTADATVTLSGLLPGSGLNTGRATGEGQWRVAIDDLPKTRVTPPPGFAGVMTVTAEVRTGNGPAVAVARSPIRLTWRQRPPVPSDKIVALKLPDPQAPAAGNTEAAAAPEKVEAPIAPKKIEPPAPPKKIEAAAAPTPAASAKVDPPPAPKKAETTPAPRQIDSNVTAALLRRAEDLMANGDFAAARLLLQRVAETKNAQAAFQLASTYDPAVLKKYANNSVAADPALAQLWYERARDWGSSDAAGPLEALASRNMAK